MDSHPQLFVSRHSYVGRDADFAPCAEDGELVDLAPGRYTAFVKQMSFGDSKRNSRLRFVSATSRLQKLNKIGETWADTATQGICDFDVYTKAFQEFGDAFEDSHDEIWNLDPYGVYRPAHQAELIVVKSGFGDGTFTLFEVLSKGRRVGIEIEMIEPNTLYPD